jgi:glycosyltransferase involved in cell wall biosynthesis
MGIADIGNLASGVHRSRGKPVAFQHGENRIKVLRIIGRLNVGGPSIHVVNLTAGLDPDRFEQLLVAGSESPMEGSMLDYAFCRNVYPYRIPEIVTAFSLTPRDAKALAKLYWLIRKERPQIVHTHTAKAGFLGRIAARLASVPIVVHTFHGHVLHGYYSPAKNWLLRRVERSLACISDLLVTVSEQVKTDLVGYGVATAEKISVVPLGFDLDPFVNSHTQKNEFRREVGFSDQHKLVGIVGRLFPIKNHALFLKSAARIAAQEPAARFVIVGDGVLRLDLERQAHDLGIADRVLFTGWRHDLPRIYADLDVLIVSSDNEGTPVSAIEAMASSCPVIATRVGGLPDLITDRKTGLLVHQRDTEELAAAVVHLLDSPELAESICRNAAVRVRHSFTVQRLVADIDHLYGQLLERKDISFPSIAHAQAREGT